MDNKDNNIEELEEQEIENDNFSDDTDFNENSNNNQSYGSYATPSPRNGNFFQGFTAGFKNGMHGGVNPNNDNLARGINPNKNNQNHNTDKKNDDTKKKLNTKENNKNRNPIPGIINKVNRKNKNANNKENNSNNNKGGLNKKENDSNQESSKNPFKKQDNELKQAESQSEGAQLFNQIKKIAKKLIKFLMFLGPIGIVIFIILFIIILIVVILGGSEAYGSSFGSYCTGRNFDISDIADISSPKTYTGVFEWAWDKTSGQYKFYEETPTYIDEDGFLRTGEDYIIALGEYFGTEKGTRYIIEMESGQTFTASLGDTKSRNDPLMDETLRYHKSGDYANILEFEMGCGTVIDPVEYGFNFSGESPEACGDVNEVNKIISDKFPGNVKSIRLLQDDSNCNFNGQFVERTTSIYTDRAALDTIFSIAPGARANYDPLGLRYQCVTYAKLRAIEILNTNTVLSSEQKEKAINQIEIAQGNGWAWTVDSNSNLQGFSFDKTCTDFRAGSIIAFSGSGANCPGSGSPETGGVKCGHVAIIESVDYENNTFTISDSWDALKGLWHSVEYNMEDVDSYYGGCRGITHLLSYTG